MSPRKALLAAAVALAGAGGWYLFRPERAFIDRRVDEPGPDSWTTVLLTGQFMPRTHEGRGRAEVLELPGGERMMRFSDFETLNGPDLQVYLLGSPDAKSRADLERIGFLSLGPLKGNVGPQNYVIPPGTDLTQYQVVAVWCRRFGVNFTTARLAAPPPAS